MALNYRYDEKALLPEIKDLIDYMYPAADDKDKVDDWVSCFAKKAWIWKGGKGQSGDHEDFKARFLAGWKGVKARKHTIDRVFVLGPGSHEVMVDGTSDYEWEDGRKQLGKWAARQLYVLEDGKLKVAKYQIHFVWCE